MTHRLRRCARACRLLSNIRLHHCNCLSRHLQEIYVSREANIDINGYCTGCDEECRSCMRGLPLVFFFAPPSSKSESESRLASFFCSPAPAPRLPLFAGGGVTGSGQPAIFGCHTGALPVSSSSSITLSTSNAVGKTLLLRFGIFISDKPAGTRTSGSHRAESKAERWQAMFLKPLVQQHFQCSSPNLGIGVRRWKDSMTSSMCQGPIAAVSPS